LRTDFRTVAYCTPGGLTDADGKASVAFRLPENLTPFTIFAVAATQADRFGLGKSAVRTVKPLLLRPALPRFARTDDRFCRMWRYYLAGSEMTFRYGRQCVFQFQLAHRRDAVPLTRDYLCGASGPAPQPQERPT
jgi:hypothetical protein